jgi:hypothetical protein
VGVEEEAEESSKSSSFKFIQSKQYMYIAYNIYIYTTYIYSIV